MIKLPTGLDINNLIADLRILSWEVSDILIYYSKMLKDPNCKSNLIKGSDTKDPVTIADLEVNELVIERLNSKYKSIDWGILSEENVKNDGNCFKRNNDWLWILDPLDGTKDFIEGTGNYAMHLALSYKNNPVFGIVLIPEKEELWISNENETWCERRDGTKRKLQKSYSNTLQEMTIVTSKNHNNQILRNLIDTINFKEIIVMGSIGCKIASIIRGDTDFYISLSLPGKSSPKDWDFAAPTAILKAFGGAITNLENEDLIFNKQNFEQGGIIIASNDKLSHYSKCSQLKEIIKTNNLYL